MGMAPALAAGGPVQRRKGVRAGRAEAAAMEEEQAVWIRRPRALERRCEMDYRRASKGPRGTGHCITVESQRPWMEESEDPGTDRHCRTVTADKLKI